MLPWTILSLPSEKRSSGYWTIRFKFVVCVNGPPLPVTVTLKVPVGVPVSAEKFTGAEAPPPGLGLVTTTGYGPAVGMSANDTGSRICVGLIKVGRRRCPLKVTVEEFMKFDPLIVKRVICDPAAA